MNGSRPKGARQAAWALTAVALLSAGLAWAQDADAPEIAPESAPESSPEATPETEAPASDAPADVAAEPPPAAPAPANTAPTISASTDNAATPRRDPAFDLRLRELEDRVNELKENIFRSKSRLMLLREQILQRGIGGSRVIMRHRNTLSGAFRVESASYALDGSQVFNSSTDARDLSNTFTYYEASVQPGAHNLSVTLRIVGNRMGVFNYMDGYEFTLRDSFAFTIEDGQTLTLTAEAYERTGGEVSIEDRPRMRFDLQSAVTVAADDTAESEAP